jgi:hypothetical protein
MNELLDMFRHERLGAYRNVDRQYVRTEQLASVCEGRRADSRYLGGRAEQRMGHLARDHVRLVAVGKRDDHVRILGAGPLEDFRVRGISDNGPHVKAILEFPKNIRILVYYRNLVRFFASQAVGSGRSDLPCAQDEYVHCWP